MHKLRYSRLVIDAVLLSLILITSTYAKPSIPIIFIHGLNGSADTWQYFGEILKQSGFAFGGCPISEGAGVVANMCSSSTSSLLVGDFYRMQFTSNKDLTLDEQGKQLDDIIKAVLAVNTGKSQVILIGHSMGGLAARNYLQFHFRQNVLKLITIGTPHFGAKSAVVCQEFLSGVPCGVVLDPNSVAVNELKPDSNSLINLNTRQLPSETSYASIIGTGQTVILLGEKEGGDGVVSISEQNLNNFYDISRLNHNSTFVQVADCGEPVRHLCETTDIETLKQVAYQISIDQSQSVPLPLPDPEDYSTPPSPPADLPKLVSAGTSSSAPNLSATVVIEKGDKSEDTNQYLRLGDLYCGVRAQNTTSVSIGSFQNKCILYDGKRAGNDPPVLLGPKTLSGLKGGQKTTTHHPLTIKNPGYYTLYGCVNTGTNPPKEKTTSDNCGTRTFLAYSVPDVAVEEVYIQGGGTEAYIGDTLTVVADVGNSGDNFFAGKNRKMTIAAELSGCVPTRIVDAVEIDDSVLHSGDHGKTKTFTVTIPPDASGTCTVTIIADPGGELQQEPNKEANRSNNSKAITIPTPATRNPEQRRSLFQKMQIILDD